MSFYMSYKTTLHKYLKKVYVSLRYKIQDIFISPTHMHRHTTCKWGEICPLLLTHLVNTGGHTEQWAAMHGARGAGVGGVRCLAQGHLDSGVGRVLLDF